MLNEWLRRRTSRRTSKFYVTRLADLPVKEREHIDAACYTAVEAALFGNMPLFEFIDYNIPSTGMQKNGVT